MRFALNPRVLASDKDRHHGAERHYVEGLRERGMLLEIGNVDVDAEQLVARTFQCDIGYCLKCSGEGAAKKYKGSCCTDLQVDLAGSELDRLRDLAERADAALDFGPRDPLGRVVRTILDDKHTEIVEDQAVALRHSKNGACALGVVEDGMLRCGINLLCRRLDLPLTEYKPAPCYVFPLHYARYRDDRTILTVLSEETRHWIKQHPTVAKLRCMSRPQPGAPVAYEFLRGEIEHLFGPEFYAELARAAEALRADAKPKKGGRKS